MLHPPNRQMSPRCELRREALPGGGVRFTVSRCSSGSGARRLLLLSLPLVLLPLLLPAVHAATAAAGALLLWVWTERRRIVAESVAVLPGLGVQLCTARESGARQERFLDRAAFSSAVINEGVDRCRIVYYMAFLLLEAPSRRELAVAFPTLLPRLHVLRSVFRETSALLLLEGAEASGEDS